MAKIEPPKQPKAEELPPATAAEEKAAPEPKPEAGEPQPAPESEHEAEAAPEAKPEPRAEVKPAKPWDRPEPTPKPAPELEKPAEPEVYMSPTEKRLAEEKRKLDFIRSRKQAARDDHEKNRLEAHRIHEAWVTASKAVADSGYEKVCAEEASQLGVVNRLEMEVRSQNQKKRPIA